MFLEFALLDYPFFVFGTTHSINSSPPYLISLNTSGSIFNQTLLCALLYLETSNVIFCNSCQCSRLTPASVFLNLLVSPKPVPSLPLPLTKYVIADEDMYLSWALVPSDVKWWHSIMKQPLWPIQLQKPVIPTPPQCCESGIIPQRTENIVRYSVNLIILSIFQFW